MTDKVYGENPPEPVNRRPEPTPAPPLPFVEHLSVLLDVVYPCPICSTELRVAMSCQEGSGLPESSYLGDGWHADRVKITCPCGEQLVGLVKYAY